MLLDRLQPYNKKGQQVLLAAPLIESKGVTRATNATAEYHDSALVPSEFRGARVCLPFPKDLILFCDA